MRIRFEKRLEHKWWMRGAVFLLSLLFALMVGGVLMAFAGISPFYAYSQMFAGTFGSVYGLSETMVKAIPLMLMGLGVGIAFRMMLWNIGAEGQYFVGALCAAFIPLFMPGVPAGLMLPLMVLAGFAGGALWGGCAGFLKAFFGTNEIITTLMMNYIGYFFLEYLVYGPWKDPAGYKFPMTAIITPAAQLPQLGPTRIHYGLFIALALIGIFHVILTRTCWGYEIRVTGENAGINIRRNIVLVMMVSGGIAGLAGMCELAGIQQRLQHGFALGYGYTAIIIAWLSRLNPLSIILVSFLFAGLLVSGDMLQMSLGMGSSIAGVLQGVILFFVLAGDIFVNYRLVIHRVKEKKSPGIEAGREG